MLKTLKGHRALVTGASRGIGSVVARRLAREGMDLVLTARDEAKLHAVRTECEALGVKVTTVACDIQRAEDRARLVEAAGEIDALVNNAGVEVTLAVLDQTDEDVRAQIETNLVAPIDLARRVLPGMVARGRGAIANVSSLSGKTPTPWNAIYAATKFGLNGFTASLAIELADKPVHVGVVCPGFVAEAGMWADTGLRAPAASREVSPEKVAQAVVDVLGGASEVLVSAGPVRPLLALRELFPSVTARVLGAMGVLDTLRSRALVAAKKHGRELPPRA